MVNLLPKGRHLGAFRRPDRAAGRAIARPVPERRARLPD